LGSTRAPLAPGRWAQRDDRGRKPLLRRKPGGPQAVSGGSNQEVLAQTCEGGVTSGAACPAFDGDFGWLGILIGGRSRSGAPWAGSRRAVRTDRGWHECPRTKERSIPEQNQPTPDRSA
jgi:hypothetical protein